ncbi:MAG: sigma-70 family RNA polymerase sigma factor [Gammaproteobacteria bacterium]
MQQTAVRDDSGSRPARHAGRRKASGDATIVAFQRQAGHQADFQAEGQAEHTVQTGQMTIDSAAAPDFAALLGLIATKRDRAAFITVYKHFAPRVRSFLIGQNVVPSAADDVLQEVMIAVWNKAKLFDPNKAAPSTWIFAIARNKRIDRIRRESKPELDPEEPSLQPSAPETADDDLLHGQRKTAIAAALTELPEEQRIVIEYSFMKGLSHGEIAEQLGLPLGTVKSRIRLAFGRLRTELGDLK